MNISVSEETNNIITTFTRLTVEEFLEKTKNDILKEYQGENKIIVTEAARIMGVSEQFIRYGLRDKELPFGVAIKTSAAYVYYISPKLFYEYVGYKENKEV